MTKSNLDDWEKVGTALVRFFYDPEKREMRIPIGDEPDGRLILVPILSREVDGERVFDCRVNERLLEAVEGIEARLEKEKARKKQTLNCHKARLEDVVKHADCGCFAINQGEKGDA